MCSPLYYIHRSQQEVPKCPSESLLVSVMQLPGQELPKGDLVQAGMSVGCPG